MAAGEMAEADTAVSDSDDDEEEGDVKIVLHQPEEWDEDETGEEMGEDDYTEQDAEELLEGGEEGMGDGANGAAGTSTDEAASTLAVRAGAAKSASAKVTPAKKSKSDAGGSATTAKGVKAAKAETAKALAALKARLGPVAHMPGGLLVDLDMAPENLDLDSIQDPGWKRPDADPTDYFNYGFNEETWRFYCQRQKEIRAEVQSIPKAAAAQNSAGVGGQMGAQAAGPMAAMHMGAPAGMGGVMGFPLNPAMAMQMQAMQQQRMAQMQMQMQQQMQQQMMQRQMMQRQQQMQAPPQGQPQLNQLQAIKQMLQQRMQEQQQAAGHVSGQLAGGQQWAADAEESDGTHAFKRGRR